MFDTPHATRERVAVPHNKIFRSSIIGVLLAAAAIVGLQTRPQVSAQSGDITETNHQAQIDPTQPQVGPGLPFVGSNAPRSAASSAKAGSVLFFHKFTSETSRPNQVNTLLTITNTNPRDAVTTRVFFISNCFVEDQFVTLVANQSRTLVASKEVPGKTGYAMAVAVNSQGLPTQFNWLIGNASLRDAAGHEASYNAFAAAKRSAGAVRFNDGGSAGDMVFNGIEYDRLPKVVAVDNLQNQDPVTGPAVTTDLSIFSPLADLSGLMLNSFKVRATLYDHTGQAFPQDVNLDCSGNANVGQIWMGTPFNTIIAANRPGWATFSANNDVGQLPVLGLSLTDGTSAPMHNARVMQTLEWIDSFRITTPVKFPENPVSDVVTQELPSATGGSEGPSETKAGSVLLYPRFISGEFGGSQLYLTNTHPTEKARLRVFFSGLVDPAVVKESMISVPALQTAVLNPDELAPNQRGWVMVMAIDGRALPTQFNYLIGSAQVSETSGQKSSFNALAIAKNKSGSVSRNNDLQTVDLLFNDEVYDRLPATTAMTFVLSQVDNSTLLGFSRPANSLLEPPNTRGAATAMLYDDLLVAFGANVPRTETRLNQIRSSVLAPPITNTLLSGEHGWLKLLSSTPVISWSLNLALQSFSATGNGGYRGGFSGDGNLHILTTAETHVMKVPATNPNNHPPIAIAETIGLQVEARRAGGVIVRLDGSSSSDQDPNDPLTYEWTDNDLPVSSARIADRKLGIGAHNLKLVVSDGSGVGSLPDEQTVTVVDSTPPRISGVPSSILLTTNSDNGEAVNFALPIAYDMVDGSIPVTTSKLSGSVFPLGKTVVTFTARDRAGNQSTANLEVTLTLGSPAPPTGGVVGDKAPLMDNINDQYVKAGDGRSLLLQAADPDGDLVTFTLLGAPSYAQIISGDPGSRTATLRIAPGANDTAAATNVRVVLNDGRGQTFTTLPFRIMVSDVPNDDTGSGVSNNQPPIAVITPLPAMTQATSKLGADLLLDATRSSDPDGDSLTFSWFDGDILLARGAVANVNLAVGTHAIKLVAFDGKDGLTTSGPVAIEVTPRELTAVNATPNRLDRKTILNLVITGTGFNPAAEVRFGKEGISITSYVAIEEDRIEVTINVAENAIPGYRDIYVVNPNGRNVRLRSGLFVNP